MQALIWFLILSLVSGSAPGAGTDKERAVSPPAHADALWRIVHYCVDSTGASEPPQCPKPRDPDVAASDPRCVSTTQVWAENALYVAIRDQKMCNCTGGFVHGLAIPSTRITGIEADDLPEGIWTFAWDAARTHIKDEESIALVVNPPLGRTQNQLHIHLVRLRPGARQRFAGVTVTVPHLDQVWSVAKTLASRLKLENYGLLVAKALRKDGFTVLVQGFTGNNSPENEYVQDHCARSRSEF